MSKKATNEQRINEILNSLDGGVHRAAPRPFFYGRISARLKERHNERWERIEGLISKPAVVFASIALFLTINMAVLFHSSETNTTTASQEESTVMGDNEYSNLSVASLYDINPDQNDLVQK